MQYRPSSAYNTPFLTTNSGLPVSNNTSALTVGSRGTFDYNFFFDRARSGFINRKGIERRIINGTKMMCSRATGEKVIVNCNNGINVQSV